jgi:phosphoribosyl-dephospho-CoA transferase
MNPESDLDLLIRMPKLLPREAAKSLVAQLEERACCRFDIQLETPAGGLSLREWANGIRKVMIKTEYGPCLLADPWQQTELAA